MSIVKIYTPSDARSSIFRRVQWEDQKEMPASVLDGIERIFGAAIPQAEAVARILRDVRPRAMRRCTSGRSGSTGGRPVRWKCRPRRHTAYPASAGGTAVGAGSGCRTHRDLSSEAADELVGGGGAGWHARDN